MKRLALAVTVLTIAAAVVGPLQGAQAANLIPYRWPHFTGRFWYVIGYPAGWVPQSFGEGGVVFYSPDRLSNLAFLAGTFQGALTPQAWLERIFLPDMRRTVPDVRVVGLQDISYRVASTGARAIEVYAAATLGGVRVLYAWQIMSMVVSDRTTGYTFTVIERYQLDGIPLRGGEARLRTMLESYASLTVVLANGQRTSPEMVAVDEFNRKVWQMLGGNY